VRTRIDFGAHLEDTYVMGADYYQSINDMDADARNGIPRIGIGEGAVIRNAIIDKNARIGKNVRIENVRQLVDHDDEHYFVRDGIVIVPKGGSVPDGTII